jgi:hypothetical protein
MIPALELAQKIIDLAHDQGADASRLLEAVDVVISVCEVAADNAEIPPNVRRRAGGNRGH